ncbi:MAG: hypothetical protein PF495_13310 [Spirochaetales bacterium]|jgi:hypothetical protein|nr:hypothetical protein [Spirochaetales bacterium]
MSLIRETMFSILLQDGPFSTPDDLTVAPFSKIGRQTVALLVQHGEQTKYRVLRNQVFDLLGVHSYGEIEALIQNPTARKEATVKAYRLLGNMFGIRGSEGEVVATVNNYSHTADGVIRYLKDTVLDNFTSFIEMTNEVDALFNPVELMLLMFDERYHKKARFEAKRKLLLMNLAGSIDQRERETNIESKFSEFLEFLNHYVWSPEGRIGELELSYLFSEHGAADFSCQKCTVLSLDAGKDCQVAKGQKLTLLKRRRFIMDGISLPIYVSIRKKPPAAKVLKLIRKGEENPAVAVDHEHGLMAVLDSLADVKAFQAHLTRSAIAADSFMVLEDISDTLTTSASYRQKNAGSSVDTKMLKFFARLGGMRVEFIVHTNESYLNYMYQRGVAHDEYEVKRVFDSGAAALLFPEDIYHLDMSFARKRQIECCRSQLEG